MTGRMTGNFNWLRRGFDTSRCCIKMINPQLSRHVLSLSLSLSERGEPLRYVVRNSIYGQVYSASRACCYSFEHVRRYRVPRVMHEP